MQAAIRARARGSWRHRPHDGRVGSTASMQAGGLIVTRRAPAPMWRKTPGTQPQGRYAGPGAGAHLDAASGGSGKLAGISSRQVASLLNARDRPRPGARGPAGAAHDARACSAGPRRTTRRDRASAEGRRQHRRRSPSISCRASAGRVTPPDLYRHPRQPQAGGRGV